MNACRLYWWLLNIGQGNVLVPADNKPLLEPMLTKFYDTLLCQQAPISYHVDGNIYTVYAEKQTRKMHHLRHGRVYFSISACISSRVNLSVTLLSLLWCHNGRDVVSNHQTRNCLLNRLFRRRSKKASKHPSLAFVRGIHRWPMNSPHKWPVTRKMYPFDDVVMCSTNIPSQQIEVFKVDMCCLPH